MRNFLLLKKYIGKKKQPIKEKKEKPQKPFMNVLGFGLNSEKLFALQSAILLVPLPHVNFD